MIRNVALLSFVTCNVAALQLVIVFRGYTMYSRADTELLVAVQGNF